MATRKRPGTPRDYIGGIPEQGYVPRGGGWSGYSRKTPAEVQGKEAVARANRPGGRTAKERKELMERTKENRRKIKEADAAAKRAKRSSTSVPKKKTAPKTQEEISAIIKGHRKMGQKIRGAEQIQGPKRKTPAGQKGRLLPRKGETVLRSKGGSVRGKSKARIF
jgi:ATPase subunit of ABC transporter with duplicated ATPase domains